MISEHPPAPIRDIAGRAATGNSLARTFGLGEANDRCRPGMGLQ